MSAWWVAVDIGTNTVMTLAACARQGRLAPDREWFQTTRLGEGLEPQGALSAGARERTLSALAIQRRQVREHCSRGHGFAVATSAVREASDGEHFLDACAAVIGGKPVCLEGAEEARFAWRGAVFDLEPGIPVVQVDIGGGSTEISAGRAGSPPKVAVSLPLGAVRLAERFELQDESESARVAAARSRIHDELASVVGAVLERLSGDVALIVASGGTATTFASMHQALEAYDAERLHGYAAAAGAVGQALPRLLSLDRRERARLPGVPADRAAILPAGLLILDEVLRIFQADAVRVSTRGLRFGITLALAAGDIAPAWSW